MALPSDSTLVTLTFRVERETADKLKAIADREYRSVAAELRRLAEDHVTAAERAIEEAA